MKNTQPTQQSQASRQRRQSYYTQNQNEQQGVEFDRFVTGMRDLFELIHTSPFVTTTEATDTQALLDYESGYRHLLANADQMTETEWHRQFKALADLSVRIARRVESGDIQFSGVIV